MCLDKNFVKIAEKCNFAPKIFWNMKTIKTIIAAIVVVCGLTAVPANAQFRIGPKVGINVNSLHFNDKTFDRDNRVGFNAGVMTEFTVPVIGIGMDASVMYVRRNSTIIKGDGTDVRDNRDYIDIPINLKYKLNIPVISSIIAPYLATGPAFAFLTSKRDFKDFRNRKCDVAWNFGFGAELVKHLQIGASYGIGLNKAVGTSDKSIEGKNRYWTVTAAYLF